MKDYIKNSMFIILILLSGTIASANETIKIVKADAVMAGLLKQINKDVPSQGTIDKSQIGQVKYGSVVRYIVPVKVNSGGDEGCYFYSYDESLKLKQKIQIVSLEELEVCVVITSISACNLPNPAESGIVTIYAKKIGFDHIESEGTYVTMKDSGDFKVDAVRTRLIADIDTAANAKKRLKCLTRNHR